MFLDSGEILELIFCDHARSSEELKQECKNNQLAFIENNLIVFEEVAQSNTVNPIEQVVKEG